MRVFVATIAILLLPYCSTEEKSCGENVGKVREFYRDKNSSFGYFQTTNFPKPFETPITQRWIINASAWQSPFQINVYLTQLYIADYRYLKFYHSESDPCLLTNIKEGRESAHAHESGGDWKSAILITTHLPYLEIELKLESLYNSHLRTDYFLGSYGFNMTYEIVPGNHSHNDSCTLKRCSYAGNCYVDRYYKRFYCDCHKDHYGDNCEYGPKCNPKKNINSCLNGGKCRYMPINNRRNYEELGGTMRSLGGAAMRCDCKHTGYKGLRCEKEDRPVTSSKDCPGPYCDTLCSSLNDTSKSSRPCSCHNGSMIPKGWRKYEGKLKLVSPSLPIWDRRNSSSVPRHIIDIEKELTRVLKAETGSNNMEEVIVTSVGDGSEFLYQFVGQPSIFNKSFDVLTQLKSKGELKKDYKLGSTFKFDKQPVLKMKPLLQSHQKNIWVGRQFSITCVAVGSSEIQFSWFKNGFPINKSIASRHIDIDANPRNGADESSSVLSIAKASPFDSGTFTCRVSDMGEDKCMDMNIDIFLPPQIDILPMSLTLLRNESAIVNCIDNQYGKSGELLTAKKTNFEWEKNDQKIIKAGDEVAEELYPQGKFLRIIRAVESAKFTCRATNLAGESKREIQVEVLESRNSPSCRNQKEIIGDVLLEWKWCAPKQVAMEQCPKNYVGYVQRACLLIGSKAQWGLSDFSKCLCSRLQSINTTLQNLKMGFAVLSDIDEIWELIGDYISNKTILYPGEGEKIISVLYDISDYILARGTATKAFPSLYKIVSKFLRFPESCVQQRTVMLLNRLMEKMILNYTYISSDTTHLFVSEDLVIESMKMVVPVQFSFPYIFPRASAVYPNWLQIRANVPVDNSTTLIFVVFRNITNLLSPFPKEFRSGDKSLHLVSSIVKLVPPSTVFFYHTSMIQLFFNISENDIISAESSKQNLTCGALQQFEDGIEWLTNACSLNAVVNNTVHCECDRFGQYAVLLVSSPKDNEEDPELPLNWCVITGCISCIVGCTLALIVIWFHIQFRIEANSLYTLKTFACLSLIMSILIILSLRNNESSISLSTCLCSLLIISLCCQLTKSLNIMFSIQMELYPWLKTVSLVTLFGAVSFGSVLPVLTAAAILSHSRSVDKDAVEVSVLNEESPVFVTFIATVSIIVLAFLFVYYKTVLTVRSIRAKVDPSKVHVLDYRTKTLNRALLITLSILLTILATVLYGNIRNVPFYQYFFGLTTFATGLIVFFSYTIKSEYPIPLSLTKNLESGQPALLDPERPIKRDSERENTSRTVGKSLENGPVSSILLQTHSLEPQLGSEAETTLDTFVGSSTATTSRQGSVKRTSSFSSMKRPSISSNNKIPRSMTNPPNFASSSGCIHDYPHHRFHRPCSAFCKKNKRSHGGSSNSSQGFGSASSTVRPLRGRCLLRDEYVMPSSSGQIDGDTTIKCPSSSKEIFENYIPHQPPSPPKSDREIEQFRTFPNQQFKVDVERCDIQKTIGFDRNVNPLSSKREERIIEGDTDTPTISEYEENIPASSYIANGCELADKTEFNPRKSITELQYLNNSGENKSDPDLVKKISQDLDYLFDGANPQAYVQLL